MPVCPECDSLLDFDADEVDEGEVVICEECGTEYEVVGTDPLELSKVDADKYEGDAEDVADEDEG